MPVPQGLGFYTERESGSIPLAQYSGTGETATVCMYNIGSRWSHLIGGYSYTVSQCRVMYHTSTQLCHTMRDDFPIPSPLVMC